MPAFQCCGLEWKIADDDFVPAAFVFTTGRFILFLWSCINLIVILAEAPVSCKEIPLWGMTLYLTAELFYEFLSFLINFLILMVSKSGTIQKNESRVKWMQVLLTLRAILILPELCLILSGLVIAWHPGLTANAEQCTGYTHNLIAAYSAFITLLSVLQLVAILLTMDPCGCYSPGPIRYIKDTRFYIHRNLEDSLFTPMDARRMLGDKYQEHIPKVVAAQSRKSGGSWFLKGQQKDEVVKDAPLYNRRTARLWQRRLQNLAGQSTRSDSTVHDIAKIFGIVFQDNKYVLSDIVAAIILEKREQKKLMCNNECYLERELRKKLIQQMKPSNFIDRKSDYKYQPPKRFNFENPAEVAELNDVIYYFQYAKAVYGWPLVLFNKPLTGCCKLSYTTCGMCCSGGCRKCACNNAAFHLLVDLGVSDEDIVHWSTKNELFHSPYVILLDHKRKALVVAIRGTLSLEDSITCMSVAITPLTSNEPELQGKDIYVHHGWHETALNIYVELNRLKILDTTFAKYPQYRLVVLGHSLGGAVASILSVLIKFHLKNHAHRLKCFSYSSPGIVFSYPVAVYCKSFVTTVVLDNDLIPRLNWRSLLYFKKSLERHLSTCQKPKYKILYTDSLPACLNCVSAEHELDDITAKKEYIARRTQGLATLKRLKEHSEDRHPLKTPQDGTSSPPMSPGLGDFRKSVVLFIESVYNEPDWESLGHFSGTDISLQGAVTAVVAAGRWKRKALGPSQSPHRPRVTTNSFEKEARTVNRVPAFPPGKILQITTNKNANPACPMLSPVHYDLHWKSNEDYCLIRLEGGRPFGSHLPHNISSAFSAIKKDHLFKLNLQNIEKSVQYERPEESEGTFQALNDIMREDLDAFHSLPNGENGNLDVNDRETATVRVEVELHQQTPPARPRQLIEDIV